LQLRQLPPVLSSKKGLDLENARFHDRSRSAGSTQGEAIDFPHFSNLPLELQTVIWEMACQSEPQRVVSVYSQHVIDVPLNPKLYWTGFISTAPIPAVLHTSSLSRRTALKYYELCFGMTRGDETIQPMIYFNYEKDMLYFQEDRPIHKFWRRSCFEQFFALVNPSDIARVRHLGFPSNLPIIMHYTADSFHKDLRLWKGLQMVSLGYNRYGLDMRRAITFIPLEDNCWTFAKSCWNDRCKGSLLIESISNMTALNRNNYKMLLQKFKVVIEDGTSNSSRASGQDVADFKPSFQAVFGTFQNT
jgi:hypothetical protein